MPVVVCVLATLTYWSVDKNSSCHDHDRHRQILILFPFISTVSAGKKNTIFLCLLGLIIYLHCYGNNHNDKEEDGKEKDAKEENDKEDDDKEDDNEKDNKEEEEDDEDNEEEDEEEVEDDNK